jgi:hypothetical protein
LRRNTVYLIRNTQEFQKDKTHHLKEVLLKHFVINKSKDYGKRRQIKELLQFHL